MLVSSDSIIMSTMLASEIPLMLAYRAACKPMCKDCTALSNPCLALCDVRGSPHRVMEHPLAVEYSVAVLGPAKLYGSVAETLLYISRRRPHRIQDVNKKKLPCPSQNNPSSVFF